MMTFVILTIFKVGFDKFLVGLGGRVNNGGGGGGNCWSKNISTYCKIMVKYTEVLYLY